jgi:dCMP deaminase
MDKWDKRWMQVAELVATWSEDQSTKVGCVIVDPVRQNLIQLGWNGLPRGILNTEERNERPEKYKWFEHAERNAIYNAASSGVSGLTGNTLYVTLFPCCDCMRGIIQAGIPRICTVSPQGTRQETDYCTEAKQMAKEAGIIIDVF